MANDFDVKAVRKSLSPVMLDALLYGARQGYQGSIRTNRRTEDALERRGLITWDHEVRDSTGDRWLSPVLTTEGWALVWYAAKVERPADEGRLPIGSALKEAYDPTTSEAYKARQAGTRMLTFPESWTEAIHDAARNPYGRFRLATPGHIVAALGARGLATLAPVRLGADPKNHHGYDFCLTDAGWLAAGLERPANDPDRLSLEEALEYADQMRQDTTCVGLPDWPVADTRNPLEGCLAEITFPGGKRRTVRIMVATPEALALTENRNNSDGGIYEAHYTVTRGLVKFRVLATPEEEERGDARLSLEEALAFLPEAGADGRVKIGFRPTTIGDAARLALMIVDRPNQVVETGDQVELTWKMTGRKTYGTVDRFTEDSISWQCPPDGRGGISYSSAYRRVVTVRVLATRAERERPARPTLEEALELAYPVADELDVPWTEGVTFRDLLEEAREPVVRTGLKPSMASISAKLDRLGFGRYAAILRNTAALSGFRVSKGFRKGVVTVSWRPGSDFDHLNGDAYDQEVNRQREHMTELYVQALKDAGYAVRSNGHTVEVSPS